MIKRIFGWLGQKSPRWTHLHGLPRLQFGVLLTGVFLLFTVVGFYSDLLEGGRMPYAIAIMSAIISGLNASLWVFIAARAPMYFTIGMIVLQFYLSPLIRVLRHWMEVTWHPAPVASEAGLHFAATSILVAVILSYSILVRFMTMTGRDAMRIKSELALAHSIQKTLVPPVSRTTGCFEIYGISEPSDKVGGDLVDVVTLPNGDMVAYVADIAGHGLQAGILMGMLKTAARTTLTDEDVPEDGEVLSQLMLRLDRVLPQVKESHMYATFTALRLKCDGQSFYGMAASPPMLVRSASRGTMRRIEDEQFPLGLLPVSDFPASRLALEPGDLVVIATDGILEVDSEIKTWRKVETGAEFGIEALKTVIAENAALPLSELAASILKTVRSYGKQQDDQTLLLVRRLAR